MYRILALVLFLPTSALAFDGERALMRQCIEDRGADAEVTAIGPARFCECFIAETANDASQRPEVYFDTDQTEDTDESAPAENRRKRQSIREFKAAREKAKTTKPSFYSSRQAKARQDARLEAIETNASYCKTLLKGDDNAPMADLPAAPPPLNIEPLPPVGQGWGEDGLVDIPRL